MGSNAVTNWIAIYAAVVSTIVAGWNIWTQYTTGPRLRISVQESLNTGMYGDQALDLTISNYGSGATTINNVEFIHFTNWWEKLRKQSTQRRGLRFKGTFVSPNFPMSLIPGAQFSRTIRRSDQWVEFDSGLLFIAVTHSHSARPQLFRFKSD